ncbi:hypothetical protein Nhal_0812 [Nitrosococcus halophilus Nc 4]|uniref:Uncharacterized protein n=1 Tax=Nitrosococcus halophilus (strain Nc4) TaxID=472759 RepID=D5BXN2_NITHN|nr:hypothetical protein [Nitrosococcus halophilus]ADE13990.1 hypothetical protein Nhal_0812 [Nitrosococcus halophilus Nc 4]
MKNKRTLGNTVLTLIFLIWSQAGVGGQADSFMEGCLKSRGANRAQCECMYKETQGKLPAEEAAFIIASMSGDMAAIQEAAAKLSPEQKQKALFSWPGVIDKCVFLK